SDCLPGLFCGPDATCQTADPYFGFTPWSGPVCPAVSSDTEAPRVLFEIERTEATPFYHLPYPNDLRAKEPGVDLSGFALPGSGVVGVDVVQRLAQAAETTQTGFSRTPVVRFRFSHSVDFGSIEGDGGDDGVPTLHYVNVDLESSGYGSGPGFSWYVTDGGGQYLCPRWLALKTNLHSPLLPNTTYAAFLTDGIRTPEGVLLTQDDEFSLMMGEEEPEAPALAAAWQMYEPLRAYLDSHEFERDNVIVGTVFTTAGGLDIPGAIRAAIENPADDTQVAFAPCQDDGPCGQQLEDGCPTDNPDLHELHGRLSVPLIQEGNAPFIANDGEGGLSLDADGNPQTTGTTEVCVSLTIPAGVPMPAGGWPVVVYGHDFGGDFRSAIDELGDVLWDGGAAGPAPVAVVGWQAPLHGDRGSPNQAPLAEAYALDNPDGIRGNIYQGASDIFALVSALETLNIPAADNASGTAIQLNMERVAYMGHGGGATAGILAVPHESRIQFSIWAGAGADLPSMLMSRTSPVGA
ncbi:MAG: hypothetical protein VX938_01115, partial [Myxococcota bacterium]|nr:hypothetical protein [Myxococcota bacterium]